MYNHLGSSKADVVFARNGMRIRACMVLDNLDRGDIIQFVVEKSVDPEYHNVGSDDQQDGLSMRDYVTKTYFG